MKFQKLFIFLLLPFGFLYSQEVPPDDDDSKIRRYIPLQDILEKNIKLTRKDSLAFHFSKGDTLVLITPRLETYFPEGIQVRVEPQDSVFIEKYKTAVYGLGNRSRRDKQSIKIWKDGIRLYFDPSVPKKHQRELLSFAGKLDSEIDSLTIRKVSERSDANYLIFYRNDKEDFDLDPRIANSEAGYYLNWKNNSYFTRASLKVNTFSYENEQRILMDLKKRFFETLGYFHAHIMDSCGSFLSACGEEKELTKEDLDILKYHYSYQNCVGIGYREFECHQDHRRKIFSEQPYARIYVSHPKNI